MSTELNNAFVGAARHGDFDTVKSSLVQGASVNAKDKHQRPALYLAAKEGYLQIVDYLIEQKAEVNATDTSENSAVMQGAINGHSQVVYSLIRAGANLCAENKAGLRPHMLASKRGHNDLAQAILDAGGYADMEDDYDAAAQIQKQAQWTPPANPEDAKAAEESVPIAAPVVEQKTPVQGTVSNEARRVHCAGWKHRPEPIIIKVGVRFNMCIEESEGTHFIVENKDEGKFKSMVITGCHDLQVDIPSTIGNVEIINSTKITVTASGTVPIYQIDGCSRIFVELSEEGRGSQFYTSNSSSVNIRHGDVETPLPEQIRHTFDGSWALSSEPVPLQ
jgi:ankyrin repeat protein